MYSIYQSIGIPIEVAPQDSIHSYNFYASRVEDFTVDNQLLISTPMMLGESLPIIIGQTLQILTPDPKKLGHFYSVQAFVMQEILTGSHRVYLIRLIGDISYIQRRGSFRLSYLEFDQPPKLMAMLENKEKIGVIDISSSGIKLLVNKEYQKHSDILININLDTDETITVKGHVKYCLPQHRSNKFHLGVQFKNISKLSKEMIIKFIFKEQGRLIYEKHGKYK